MSSTTPEAPPDFTSHHQAPPPISFISLSPKAASLPISLLSLSNKAASPSPISLTPTPVQIPLAPAPSRASTTPTQPPTHRNPPPQNSPGPSLSAPSSIVVPMRVRSSSNTSTGMIAGMTIGGVAIIAVLSSLFIYYTKKKNERRNDGSVDFPPTPRLKAEPDDLQVYQTPDNAPPPRDLGKTVSSPPAVAPHSPVFAPSPQPLLPSSQTYISSRSNRESGHQDNDPPPPPFTAYGSFSKSTFSYEELAIATDGFSDANLLGQGGFGNVHKGILTNGEVVAVKRLQAGSQQGEREFRAEVEIISRVHHKHLVSLFGYCISGSTKMLVYEFVPNNTLEFHLHGKGRTPIDWPTRLKIALGAAKGFAYLHEECHPKIIHRDIKSANILVDFNFEAKVADFGLAKFAPDINSHVSTRVIGTFGYLAPEYASSGKLTEKSDVFSFGVVLLELITGRRPVYSTPESFMPASLVDWARPLLTQALDEGNFDSLVDPRLQNNYDNNEMARIIAFAAASVRRSAKHRPRMSQIVRALEGDVSLYNFNERIRPGQSAVYYSSHGSSEYGIAQYNEDMKNFRKIALQSKDYGSSEYRGPSGEYALYSSS
ncbi:hypothetical protein ACH5RR_004210 [Cinchona calisaya]|uniref:non-specific serine/threonine protein kinase n=1 Tax=Cinchona calisaya TaxID=153742 RepID=A0ABD3AX09_9GENT